MKQKYNFTKPYRVPIMVDNRSLPYKSIQASAHVMRTDVPKYNGEIRYACNPFWITLFGGSEFQLMKTIRKEYPQAEILEIR